METTQSGTKGQKNLRGALKNDNAEKLKDETIDKPGQCIDEKNEVVNGENGDKNKNLLDDKKTNTDNESEKSKGIGKRIIIVFGLGLSAIFDILVFKKKPKIVNQVQNWSGI
ncbi:MAG: hypothetical protein Rpha_1617 [Candidatus Ruthia sp. Apha_13_S6]|nr:hypothetical protein [Candidatus Ruthia sp. Apha_13_S6]